MGVVSNQVKVFHPGSFEASQHFYPRVLNAQIHPLVRHFFSLDKDRIIKRFCHLHPNVYPETVRNVLNSQSKHFFWGGADLFHTTTRRGERRIVIIETNSSPSGQKSMPVLLDGDELGGYRTLMERALLPLVNKRPKKGVLAVIYDKNEVETSGYAAALAELADEPVYYVPFHEEQLELPEEERNVRIRGPEQGIEIKTPEGDWEFVRGALRYVTQRPWNRLPLVSRTALLNPIVTCLAGGRNKLLAAKAYDFYNAELRQTGLQIRFPETIWDVSRDEIPLWVKRMGGFAVVKNPYSNAGQGVWTITSASELEAFMTLEHRYERFIVQSLVGNSEWSSESLAGRFYHVGTVPDRHNHIYVADLRFMVGNGPDGFFPVAIYARRARSPLTETIAGQKSWDLLGTNLSIKSGDNWSTEPERLLLMDSKDFNLLGLGLDDIIEAYIQSVLAVIAIDKMACNLVTQKKTFRRRFFSSLNPDPVLVREIYK